MLSNRGFFFLVTLWRTLAVSMKQLSKIND